VNCGRGEKPGFHYKEKFEKINPLLQKKNIGMGSAAKGRGSQGRDGKQELNEGGGKGRGVSGEVRLREKKSG